MTIDVLLSRLDGVRSRGTLRWVARCPAHIDRSPSLSIRALPDGHILIHDFGGCEPLTVLEAIGLEMQALFPERLPDQAAVPAPHAHAAADAIRVMAREALVLIFAAHDMASGIILSPATRERMLEAALTIRGAARLL